MKDEKKVTKAEEVKEEKGVELTDEQMAQVTGGSGGDDDDNAALVVKDGSGMCK